MSAYDDHLEQNLLSTLLLLALIVGAVALAAGAVLGLVRDQLDELDLGQDRPPASEVAPE